MVYTDPPTHAHNEREQQQVRCTKLSPDRRRTDAARQDERFHYFPKSNNQYLCHCVINLRGDALYPSLPTALFFLGDTCSLC